MKVLFVRSGNRGIDPISQNQGESLRKEGVEVHYFNIVGKGLIGYLGNVIKLKDVVKKINPNLIHAHYSLSGYITVLIRTRKPILTSLMGSDLNNAGKWHRILMIFFIKYMWKHTIVKSEEMLLKIKHRKVSLIPNGVDFQNYYPIDKYEALNELKWDINKKHVLFASNPKRPEKNFKLAKDAFELLDSSQTELHYLQGISQDQLKYYYNAADVLLLTSLSEGSPNVIKEAMACNCPIVSTRVGDVEKVIGNTQGCYLVSFCANEVTSCLKQAIEFAQRTTGRITIDSLRSEKIAMRIISLYKKLIAE